MQLTDLNTLKQNFSGELILPEDTKYEQARATLTHKGAPALVVRPNTTSDVAAAIHYARSHTLLLSIRSGGHSAAGFSTNTGGLVIELTAMNQIELIDADKHMVRIGAGATWGAVARTLQEQQLARAGQKQHDRGGPLPGARPPKKKVLPNFPRNRKARQPLHFQITQARHGC